MYQVGLKLAISFRIISNFCSSCLYLLGAGPTSLVIASSICHSGYRAQGFVYARQALYHLSHISSPQPFPSKSPFLSLTLSIFFCET